MPQRDVDLDAVDLAYLALFLGQRVNALVLERMVANGFADARERHGYVIQHLIGSPRTITEIGRRMGVTQQAASKAVAELVGLGLAEITTMRDRRARRVSLSLRGRRCVEQGRRIRRALDRQIAKAIGTALYGQTRTALISCLDALGGLRAVKQRRVSRPDSSE